MQTNLKFWINVGFIIFFCSMSRIYGQPQDIETRNVFIELLIQNADTLNRIRNADSLLLNADKTWETASNSQDAKLLKESISLTTAACDSLFALFSGKLFTQMPQNPQKMAMLGDSIILATALVEQTNAELPELLKNNEFSLLKESMAKWRSDRKKSVEILGNTFFMLSDLFEVVEKKTSDNNEEWGFTDEADSTKKKDIISYRILIAESETQLSKGKLKSLYNGFGDILEENLNNKFYYTVGTFYLKEEAENYAKTLENAKEIIQFKNGTRNEE